MMPKHLTKYLRIIVDEHVAFKEFMAKLRQRLNRTNGPLAKSRHQVSRGFLKIIYFALFDSYVGCGLCNISMGSSNSNIVDMKTIKFFK